MNFDVNQLGLTAPILVVSVGALVLLLLEAFSRRPDTDRGSLAGAGAPRAHLAAVTLVILGVAAWLETRVWDEVATPQLVYNASIAVDRFSVYLAITFFAGAALTVLLAGDFMRTHRFEFGEFYALLLIAVAGMMILAQATDFVTLFIGLETMSLAVYVMVGSWRRSAKSSEAALKYFLVGAFASALLLYGVALIYGATGTTNLIALGTAGSPGAGNLSPPGALSDPVFLIGTFLVAAGLAFKIAAVPFHLWQPDAYEGAPTPVTAFMAAAVKAAGFAVVIRVFGSAWNHSEMTFGAGGWASLSAVLAILTMTLGNVAALRQDNLKRMLAYSSISHAGYLLIGVAAMGLIGAEARGPLLFYLLGYTFTTVGAFGVIAWYGRYGDERQHIDDWAGLGARHPAAALAMTVFLLSLGGIPPAVGFFGKFYLFRAALAKPGLMPLIVVAALNSVVSVFYYLRPIVAMYFREPGREVDVPRSTGIIAALLLAAAGVLLLGLFPGAAIDLANDATMLITLGK